MSITESGSIIGKATGKRWRQFFFTSSLRRAFLEAVIAGCTVWLITLVLHAVFRVFHIPRLLITAPAIIVTINPVVTLIFALRLRLPGKFFSFQSFCNFLSYLLLNFVLNGVGTLIVIDIIPSYGIGNTFLIHLGVFSVVSFLNAGWYVFVRLTFFALTRWNQLRRKELRWAITHAHVMIVVFTMGLLIIIGELVVVITSHGNWSIFEFIPTFFLMLGLSAIPIVIVVPPLALFSHYVTRSTVNRVQTLAKATSALRAGDYQVRVPVSGEDEVAQLQTDFNAMAQDLERAMHDLQSERDRVAALLQERRELIANVSHELRTPVATLRGYLETSLEHWEQMARDTLYQDMQVMEGEAIQLQERIEELFTLARAELGRLTLYCEVMDAGQLVQRIVEGSAPLAWRSSKIEVIDDIAESLPVVYADPQRLEQALRNLLHNALRHTAPGGIIVLSAIWSGQEICLSVKDTGEGIAAEDLAHIWERFYQAKNGLVHKSGGTGLGLALVKEWIEGMGGRVSVESQPGQGSCFTLSLQSARSQKLVTTPLASLLYS